MRNNSGGAFLRSTGVDNPPALIVHHFILLHNNVVK